MTKKVKVFEYQRFRDGGSIEYRDENNRIYIKLAPVYQDGSIYNTMPWRRISEEAKEEIKIKGIELEVINKP